MLYPSKLNMYNLNIMGKPTEIFLCRSKDFYYARATYIEIDGKRLFGSEISERALHVTVQET